MKPRYYQSEAVDAIWNYFVSGQNGNPLLAMPTGSGKSIIPAIFIQRAMRQWPNQRFLLLTHVKELIEQNRNVMRRFWPEAPIGVYSAGLGEKEAFWPIVYGGVASVKNNVYSIGHRDIIFVDECHLLSPDDTSMYQQVISQLKWVNPNVKVIGMSATPYRMGQGMLTDDGLFTDLVFDLTNFKAFNRLIEEKYLCPLISKHMQNEIDTSEVGTLAFDFNLKELSHAIRKQNVIKKALTEAIELGKNRKKWIVFAAGIANTEEINDLLNSVGILTTCVHSKLSKEERDRRMTGFKAGAFRAIVSNNILTTGFDDAQIDLIVDLRPTTSTVLHVQKYGRGTRCYYHPSFTFEQLWHLENRTAAIEAGGKHNCLVLDFSGNTKRLGPINDPAIPRKRKKGNGDAPIKLCPKCEAYNHVSARVCCDCGEEFVFRIKIKASSDTTEVLRKSEHKIEIVDVTACFAVRHVKPGKSPKLKIQYYSGLRLFNVWFDVEGIGFPLHKFHNWWRQHEGENFPKTVDEAIARFGECRKTKQLKVDTGGKYSEILEYLF